jgi:hypothetical protein
VPDDQAVESPPEQIVDASPRGLSIGEGASRSSL